MESKPTLAELARKVCAFALFGFLAITLAGPILAVLFTLLTFALIGFLLWLPLHALLRRREGGWREGVQHARCFGQRGLYALGGVWVGTLRVGREMQDALRGTASFVGAVLLEALSGALVGVLVAAACWPPHSLTAGVVVLGGLLGAGAGLLVVLSRRRSAPAPVLEQSPEGLN
ncbi:MAG: hypothetical protein L0Z62_17395 [Gemmataceae bacterium]|nr:hypothetical protein [Gemmataceae bacterium]